MKKLLVNNRYLFFVLLLSVPSFFALIHKGFFGASDDLHIAWLYEMDKLIKIGQFPPRYVPDLSFGFGYPLFNFVFPLPFYIGEIFHLLSFSLVDSVKIVFGLSFMLSGVGMYYFLKEIISSELSVLGAVIYIYTPYRSTDVYLRGAIGEALAFVFLPVLLFSVIRIYKNSQKQVYDFKAICGLSLSLAALILSHDIVSYMFFPFLLLFVFIIFWFAGKDRKVYVLSNLFGIILGLLVSLYFWLPAVVDSKLMAYNTVFDYWDHFPTLHQLITPYFGYGASVPGPYDLMSFFIGTLNLILVPVGIFLAILLRKKISPVHKGILIWAILTFFISCFMMDYRSSFLWAKIPFLPYFQFPWRFLTLTTLSSVIFLLPVTYLKNTQVKRLISIVVIALALFLNAGYFKPHDFLERKDNYYINRYIPVPVASNEYMGLQEEYLRLPLGTLYRPNKDYPTVFGDVNFQYKVVSTNSIYAKVDVVLTASTTIYYNKYYFPGWGVKIDGKDAAITAGKPYGQIAVHVPEGKHQLEFNFGETSLKFILDIVSVATFLFLMCLVLKRKRKQKHES